MPGAVETLTVGVHGAAGNPPEFGLGEAFSPIGTVERIHLLDMATQYMLAPGGSAEERDLAKRLASAGPRGVRVILDTYVAGDHDPASDDGLQSYSLARCLSEAGAGVVAEYIRNYPDAVAPATFVNLGRVAHADIIDTLRAFVGPLPPDGMLYGADRSQRLRIIRAYETARDAVGGAVTEADERAWQALIDSWKDLRFVGIPAINICEPAHPDRIALVEARRLVGAKDKNPLFPNTTREGGIITSRLPENQRVEVLQNLWHTLVASGVTTAREERIAARLLPKLEAAEYNPSPHASTVGIEIEVTEASLLRRGVRASADERLARMKRIVTGFQQAEVDGVPAGIDEEWEFAHLPVHDKGTLKREVQLLFALGLINPEYPNPLHVTVGGVTTEGSRGGAAYVMACAMMAAGWSTTSDRIRQPVDQPVVGSWAHRGDAGITERYRASIIGDTKTAVEFRVHAAEDLRSFAETVDSFALVGSAIAAYQTARRCQGLPLAHLQLAAIGKRFCMAAKALFAEQGLDDPSQLHWQAAGTTQGDGAHSAMIDHNFERLAELLHEATTQEDSPGYQFREAMRNVIRTARRKVAPILERTRPAHIVSGYNPQSP